MTRDELSAVLPWTPPALMIDELQSWEAYRQVVTTKRLFEVAADGVPKAPWFPSCMLVEGVAQSAALLYRLSYGDRVADRRPLLGWLRVRIRGSAIAGELVTFSVLSVKMTLDGGVFRGSACSVSSRLVTVELAVATRTPEPM